MSTTFCTWSVVLVKTNSNPACLGEEVDLMELDEIKSNPAWQEIEVDKSNENGWSGRLDKRDLIT